ncbi:cation diffusion facilitator family transporter [Kineosporia sp. A_224]|uniref:cation diffusion facilitator family transporter n=1 Tax=Kineosporia sp. A_224 TaxID=1962180 RepID=UPI0018E9F666|nr:cation diffusion facilitator family transporter [Kineosporia sp. A_224]
MTEHVHAPQDQADHPHGEHSHDEGHDHAVHDHDDHGHADHGDHDHGDHGDHDHDHGEGTGVVARLRHLLVPHSHDHAQSTDTALESSADGIRAVKISLVVLLATAVAQGVVVVLSGSVALLADTVHNLSDALTALPLWVAFVLVRRPPSRRYTFGLGRVEDLAGLLIVVMIALSAVVAAWESIRRLADPQPVTHLGAVLGAGVIGFLGNEAVAIYRTRVGRRIGSAALVADGQHARTDGWTSLGVVAGGLGVWLGFPLADPVVGLLITVAIVGVLVGAVRDVGRRLLDGVDPALPTQAEEVLAGVDGVESVADVRLRWIGHRLRGEAVIGVAPTLDVVAAHDIATRAAAAVHTAMPNLDAVSVHVEPAGMHRAESHSVPVGTHVPAGVPQP